MSKIYVFNTTSPIHVRLDAVEMAYFDEDNKKMALVVSGITQILISDKMSIERLKEHYDNFLKEWMEYHKDK